MYNITTFAIHSWAMMIDVFSKPVHSQTQCKQCLSPADSGDKYANQHLTPDDVHDDLGAVLSRSLARKNLISLSQNLSK